jgi:hypothetical protein
MELPFVPCLTTIRTILALCRLRLGLRRGRLPYRRGATEVHGLLPAGLARVPGRVPAEPAVPIPHPRGQEAGYRTGQVDLHAVQPAARVSS